MSSETRRWSQAEGANREAHRQSRRETLLSGGIRQPRRMRARTTLLFIPLMALALLALVAATAQAAPNPFISPGNGQSYNMNTLEAAAGGQVSQLPAPPGCHYRISENIVISNNDTLTITPNCVIEIDNNYNITIKGRLLVQGTTFGPVTITSFDATPIPNNYEGVNIEGVAFAPSVIDNLTIIWSGYGVRCMGCRGLVVSNLLAINASTDALQLAGGARDVTALNISLRVSSWSGQSVVLIDGTTNVSCSGVQGTGVAALLQVSNSSDASFRGPMNGSGIQLVGVRIDNSTNVSVSGLLAANLLSVALIVNSTLVAITDAAVNVTALSGITLRSSSDVRVVNVSLKGAFGTALLVDNVSRAWISLLDLSSSQYGLFVTRSNNLSVANVTVAALTAPLVVNQSETTWVNDSVFRTGSTGISLSDSPGIAGNRLLVDASATSLLVVGGEATMNDLRLLNGTVAGVDARSGAAVHLRDGLIGGATGAPAFASIRAQDSALVVLRDTAFDDATTLVAGAAQLLVYWTLTIGVREAGVPLPGTTVSIWNATGVGEAPQVTDAMGLSPAMMFLEFEQTTAGRSYASPYSANASNGSGFAGSVSVDLDRPSLVWIDLADVEPPHLEPRPSPQRTLANLTYDFSPSPLDTDNVGIVRTTWSFINETGEWVNASNASFNYTFSVPGRYAVTLEAQDAAGNAASLVFVVWVNAVPTLLNPPVPGQLAGVVGVPFNWTFLPADADPEDAANLTVTVNGEPGMNMIGFTLHWTPATPGSVPFTVRVSDGLELVDYRFNLLVSLPTVGNQPPVFTTTPRQDANTTAPYAYLVAVADADADDDILIDLAEGPQGMVLLPAGSDRSAQLVWNAGAFFPQGAQGFNYTFNVSLVAWDGHLFVYQNFTLLLRNPPDLPPRILPLDEIVLAPGQAVTIDLRLYGADEDDDPETLNWSFSLPADTAGFSVGKDSNDPFKILIIAPASASGPLRIDITLVVQDSSGLADQRALTIRLASQAPSEAGFSWPLLLILLVAGGAMATGVARWRQGRSPTAAPSLSSGAGFPVYLEAAALFDTRGDLLASAVLPGSEVDHVLVVLPSYLREHGPREGQLTQASVDGHDVAVMSKKEARLAVVGKFAGEASHWLQEPLSDALAQVLGRVSEKGAEGLAALESDPGVGEVLRQLLGVSAGSSPDAVDRYRAAQAVQVASVVDLVQGYVRLKVAVENKGNQIAADVRLLLDYDEKVLRLERAEPDLDLTRDRIHLGNLRPGERKTVALYFDPQICTRSFVNATVGFEDARGSFSTTVMRTRPVEVVCPAFSTPHEANTAMLRRLLHDELTFRDSKFFRFDPEVKAREMFEACKRAVQALDVRIVREKVADPPFQAEAWFYGETKVSKAKFVIWTVVFGEERVAQLAASSNVLASITGLLAELGRRLTEETIPAPSRAAIRSMKKAAASSEIGALPTLFSSFLSIGAEEEES